MSMLQAILGKLDRTFWLSKSACSASMRGHVAAGGWKPREIGDDAPFGCEQGYVQLGYRACKELGMSHAAAFGVVYGFCCMGSYVCTASQTKMADRIGLGPRQFRRLLRDLIIEGYVVDLTPAVRNRPHRLTLSAYSWAVLVPLENEIRQEGLERARDRESDQEGGLRPERAETG
jgi:hypothetical protein